MKFVVLVSLLLCGVAIASHQFPFDAPLSITSNGSQIWRHPSSDNHYIEVRACNLCVGQDLWSGYFHLTSEKISIFFVFARASTNPESAPLAIWTNGGPGASALSMAFSSATSCVLEDDY